MWPMCSYIEFLGFCKHNDFFFGFIFGDQDMMILFISKFFFWGGGRIVGILLAFVCGFLLMIFIQGNHPNLFLYFYVIFSALNSCADSLNVSHFVWASIFVFFLVNFFHSWAIGHLIFQDEVSVLPNLFRWKDTLKSKSFWWKFHLWVLDFW